MPKLWNDTIEEHRRAVRDAVLDATAALAAEHGPRAVTMSRIATESGIGRATLYKYFPDVDAVLTAWHERQVTAHLRLLTELRHRPGGTAADRLAAVLDAYAGIQRRRAAHGAEPSALLHRGEHVDHAHRHLTALVRDLLTEAVAEGDVRSDVPPAELAAYCLHATGAAADVHSQAAVRRLVTVTLDALRPGPPGDSP
ncbi:TetR/AcrR family transcriptional regulator [Streptomyces alkaliterrae]|uniref:TetR family transcriptional regulator n=1 Tax=Streptomyces alkaliterrae TaxID=2213162 RepID=A0A5P0YZH8_9ACTN|nr:TetR/AcrR family transcriptional regulator [Streptomyces alkaliterrae]MBB1261720.1 TetR/AcrR family transcriptional regulator [Streptomyces alkaliterrae]MQS03979.1 TetR family transcriptional regulator [Streptomyces alkaliterrae]